MNTLDTWIFIAEIAGLLVCIFILLGMLATFVGRCIAYGSYEQAAQPSPRDEGGAE